MSGSSTNNQCRRCKAFFIPTGDDPAVSAASLGVGIYHLRCARLSWRDQAQKAESKLEARAAKRRAHGGRLARWRAEMDAKIATLPAGEEPS